MARRSPLGRTILSLIILWVFILSCNYAEADYLPKLFPSLEKRADPSTAGHSGTHAQTPQHHLEGQSQHPSPQGGPSPHNSEPGNMDFGRMEGLFEDQGQYENLWTGQGMPAGSSDPRHSGGRRASKAGGTPATSHHSPPGSPGTHAGSSGRRHAGSADSGSPAGQQDSLFGDSPQVDPMDLDTEKQQEHGRTSKQVQNQKGRLYLPHPAAAEAQSAAGAAAAESEKRKAGSTPGSEPERKRPNEGETSEEEMSEAEAHAEGTAGTSKAKGKAKATQPQIQRPPLRFDNVDTTDYGTQVNPADGPFCKTRDQAALQRCSDCRCNVYVMKSTRLSSCATGSSKDWFEKNMKLNWDGRTYKQAGQLAEWYCKSEAHGHCSCDPLVHAKKESFKEVDHDPKSHLTAKDFVDAEKWGTQPNGPYGPFCNGNAGAIDVCNKCQCTAYDKFPVKCGQNPALLELLKSKGTKKYGSERDYCFSDKHGPHCSCQPLFDMVHAGKARAADVDANRPPQPKPAPVPHVRQTFDVANHPSLERVQDHWISKETARLPGISYKLVCTKTKIGRVPNEVFEECLQVCECEEGTRFGAHHLGTCSGSKLIAWLEGVEDGNNMGIRTACGGAVASYKASSGVSCRCVEIK